MNEVERRTGCKCCEKIVTTNCAGHTDGEYGQGEVLYNVRFTVDETLGMSVSHQVVKDSTWNSQDNDELLRIVVKSRFTDNNSDHDT